MHASAHGGALTARVRLGLGLRAEWRFKMPVLQAADAGATRIALTGAPPWEFYEAGTTRCEGFARCQVKCSIKDVPWFVSVTARP